MLAPLATSGAGDLVLAPSYAEADARHQLSKANLGAVAQLIRPGANPINNVDAATFRPDNADRLAARIVRLNVAPSAVQDDPPIGAHVRKMGATSELTEGATTHRNGVVWLDYFTAGGAKISIGFEGVLCTSKMSEPGDSGSVLLDDANAAVGMVLGATDSVTICMPMQRVLDAVGCDL